MAFLGNDVVNRFNLHSGIQAIAQFGAGIFLLVFLIHAGFSVPAALLTMSAIQALRLVLRPLVLPLAIRWGLKPVLIAGVLVLALQYPLLAQVHVVGPLLLLFCCVSAFGDVLYWPTYHSYFAIVGDSEHRGHQVSAREALIAAVGIAAPLLGAWALLALGANLMFSAFGVVQALAVLPLIGAPDAQVQRDSPPVFASARFAALLALNSGWHEGWSALVWPIALFLALGSSFSAYGGAMALAALAGAAFGMLLGKHVDGGQGRRTTLIAYGVGATLTVLRACSGGIPTVVVIANTLAAFAPPLHAAAANPPFYNLAQRSPCPLRFFLITEAAWDLGCGSACAVAAGLIALGAPMAITLLLAIPAIVAEATLLWRYYGNAQGAETRQLTTAA